MHNLEEMLDRVKETNGDGAQVSLDDILDAIGKRSFGPILLLAGLIPASPLSGVPGLPTAAAALVFLVIIQLLSGHDHFWLPKWLLKRRVSRQKLVKAMDVVRPPARWIDRFIHPRLEHLTRGVAVYAVAAVCAVIALLMPPLELIPFANTITGVALAMFGLALVSHDGVLVVLGLGFCVVAVVLTMTL